jgi:hypothetical protein
VRLRDGEPESVVNETYRVVLVDAQGRIDWTAAPAEAGWPTSGTACVLRCSSRLQSLPRNFPNTRSRVRQRSGSVVCRATKASRRRTSTSTPAGADRRNQCLEREVYADRRATNSPTVRPLRRLADLAAVPTRSLEWPMSPATIRPLRKGASALCLDSEAWPDAHRQIVSGRPRRTCRPGSIGCFLPSSRGRRQFRLACPQFSQTLGALPLDKGFEAFADQRSAIQVATQRSRPGEQFVIYIDRGSHHAPSWISIKYSIIGCLTEGLSLLRRRCAGHQPH